MADRKLRKLQLKNFELKQLTYSQFFIALDLPILFGLHCKNPIAKATIVHTFLQGSLSYFQSIVNIVYIGLFVDIS